MGRVTPGKTPSPPLPEVGRCAQYSHCGCVKARWRQECFRCGMDINPGDCIQGHSTMDGMWMHVRCPIRPEVLGYQHLPTPSPVPDMHPGSHQA